MANTVHSYRDFAHLEEADADALNIHFEDQQQSESEAKTSTGSEQNFPVKLHYMLSDIERDGLQHIVSWQPHGRCFIVHKPKEFSEQILPLWFRQSKFASFQRQLNLYGFNRLTAGLDKNGYYHECFLRGKRWLSRRIKRLKIKGTGARKPSSPETEPNFYEASYLPLDSGKAISASNVLPRSAAVTGRNTASPNRPEVNRSDLFHAILASTSSPLASGNNHLPVTPLLTPSISSTSTEFRDRSNSASNTMATQRRNLLYNANPLGAIGTNSNELILQSLLLDQLRQYTVRDMLQQLQTRDQLMARLIQNSGSSHEGRSL